MYRTGCLRDKVDKRDYLYMPAKSTKPVIYPENFQLVKTKIKDQGEVNSCVAHSISTIKEIQEYYETHKLYEFSVGWIYGYRVGTQYKGEGMYPREALNNLVKYGDVFKSDFPENLEYADLQKLVEKRKSTCLNRAKEFRCKTYARVTGSQDVKHCLYTNHSPVLVVCDIFTPFFDTKKDGIASILRKGECFSHAMTIVGWKKIKDTDYWVVQNSWGCKWGDNGYCYLRTGANIITDLYTVTDEKNVKR